MTDMIHLQGNKHGNLDDPNIQVLALHVFENLPESSENSRRHLVQRLFIRGISNKF